MAEKEIKSCSKGCEEMTDNEVIKALEVCAYSDDCLKECPFFNYKADCTKRLTASALEIIKRHQSNVSPVKHGHWVKEKSDVLTDTDKWIEQISNMVFDVNPAEITFQAQERNLKEWCLRWQQEMNMLIITAPLDYSNSKEREENA